jgi:tRNA-Thr(GGU) m(6)t(6)A37 methyltransferase TsaA
VKPCHDAGIHTPYRAKEDCPIQPAFAGQEPSRVEVYAEFAAGLKDIETFSHLILLYRFDRAGTMALVCSTFLDDTPHGIFASRHPCRPNGIGLSVVRLLRRAGDVLFIEGADMLDQSPLLDIKPYLPRYDAIPDADPRLDGRCRVAKQAKRSRVSDEFDIRYPGAPHDSHNHGDGCSFLQTGGHSQVQTRIVPVRKGCCRKNSRRLKVTLLPSGETAGRAGKTNGTGLKETT